MSYKIKATALVAISTISIFSIFTRTSPVEKAAIPIVAIANYGPHSSLFETIDGLKQEMSELGYVEEENFKYEISDINFDTSLIRQMLQKLRSHKPRVMVTISTPVTQAAISQIKDIPIVFSNITDPKDVGIKTNDPSSNVAGASGKQDLSLMIKFAKQLIPNAKTIGLLYSTAEANDKSLLDMMIKNAQAADMEVVAIPVEHSSESATRIRLFKDKVDFIYTGASGVIQSSLPAIVSAAEDMQLPIINFNSGEVMTHNILSSYGVSDQQIGANTAAIVHQILSGKKPSEIEVLYPREEDHSGFISQKRAQKINLAIPSDLTNITIVE